MSSKKSSVLNSIQGSGGCTNLHLGTIGEVSWRDMMLKLNLREDDRELVDQVLLFIVLPEDRWHLLLQVTHDMGMYL